MGSSIGKKVTPLFIKEGLGEIFEIPLNPPFVKGENGRGRRGVGGDFKIPLNPPFEKGENSRRSFTKGRTGVVEGSREIFEIPLNPPFEKGENGKRDFTKK